MFDSHTFITSEVWTTTFQSHYVVAAVLEVAEAVCSAGLAAAGRVLVGEAGGLWTGLDLRQTKLVSPHVICKHYEFSSFTHLYYLWMECHS